MNVEDRKSKSNKCGFLSCVCGTETGFFAFFMKLKSFTLRSLQLQAVQFLNFSVFATQVVWKIRVIKKMRDVSVLGKLTRY